MTQIDHPDYYKAGSIEAIDFIEAHNLNFNLGNVIKYISRAGKKQGEDRITALLKAQWYLLREVSRAGHETIANSGLLVVASVDADRKEELN